MSVVRVQDYFSSKSAFTEQAVIEQAFIEQAVKNTSGKIVNVNLIQSDKKRLIVGLGATGKSCMRHLSRLGLPFSVLDTRSKPEGIADIACEFPDVEIHLGRDNAALIDIANEIYISPGIAVDDALFANATANGAVLSGDIDLFAREVNAPVIAITGSNAKSTVTSLVGDMASQAGLDAAVGGNLGVPALELLSPQRELYVLELSSFQLERCSELKPRIACLLNLTADHMDRHGNMLSYHQAKQRVFRGAEIIVYNRDDGLTTPLQTLGAKLISFGLAAPDLGQYGVVSIDGRRFLCRGFDPLIAVADLPLPGSHNILNVLAALAIGEAAGFSIEAMKAAITAFKGLPHRCESVAHIQGVHFINDSKATNVGAALAALRGLSDGATGTITLIAGGETKGADFSELLAELEKRNSRLLVIGVGANAIAAAAGESLSITYAESLELAVATAYQLSQPGDLVLLSPACASFDMFDSFEHRGEVFCSAVSELASRFESEGLQ